MAYSRDDVQPTYAGGPTPGKRHLLTPRDFEVLDYNESLLTPPETVSNIRVDGDRRVAESSSTIQLAENDSGGLLMKSVVSIELTVL